MELMGSSLRFLEDSSNSLITNIEIYAVSFSLSRRSSDSVSTFCKTFENFRTK